MKFNRFYTNAVAFVGVASLGLFTQLPVRAQMGTSSPSSTPNQNIDIDSPSDLPNIDSQSERIDRPSNSTPFPIRNDNNTSPNRMNSNSPDRMNQDQIDIDSPSDLPNIDSQSERIDRVPTNTNTSPNRTNNNTSPNRTNSNSSDRMNQEDMNSTPNIRLPQQPIDSQPGLPNEMNP